VNKKTNNHVDVVNSTINIKNLPPKPNKGGIPAKDIKKIIIKIENDCMLPTNFNSFNVFIFLTSTKKKTEKILNNKTRYISTFNKNNEYTYSL
jgi:hypothetical protein